VRYVPDVVGQFNAFTVRPDALGFFRGTSPNPTSCKHYQGSNIDLLTFAKRGFHLC